jgi:hypothetical protein
LEIEALLDAVDLRGTVKDKIDHPDRSAA